MNPVHFWNHLPTFIQRILLGNLIQLIFVVLLRIVLKRYGWLQPVIDRVGPRRLRTQSERRGGCLLIGIAWFALSWYVGHWGYKAVDTIVHWMLGR